MSPVLENPSRSSFGKDLDFPQPHRWSAAELYRLLEFGFLAGERIELIEGEILQFAPQSNFHAISIKLTEEALNNAFRSGYWVRVQNSLDLSPHSVPDPDIAVVKGGVREHKDRSNPTSALLIVEISETTLPYDRNRKASLYARSGIAEYWIVNIEKRWLEVHRNPEADETKEFQFGYREVAFLEAADTVAPLALPNAKILVADLLP